jgi:outer membrane biosynthesis protein TonB
MANSSVSATQAVDARPEVELNLLLEWPQDHTRKEWLAIVVGTLAVHAVFFLFAIQLDSFVSRLPEQPKVIVKHTPLYLPPDVLTQKAANKAKLSKQISLADLLASQAAQQRSQSVARPSAPRAAPPPPKPAPRQQLAKAKAPEPQPPKPETPAPPTQAKILPEPPKLALNQPPPSLQLGQIAPAAPPAPAPAQETGPFQNAISNTPPIQNPTIVPPRGSLQAAIQGLSKDPNSRRVIINDDNNQPSIRPGVPGSMNHSPGQHAQVELKSDPQGADLHLYLAQILAIVRGNWRRVIPESVNLGKLRGVTGVEFAINRDGSIAKVVVADPSGSDPLDRASIAGLSMSNPLPPLPAEYKGLQLRLAFQFAYNMPNQ